MKKRRIGVIITGGPVQAPLLNTNILELIRGIRKAGCIPIGFSGGFFPLLANTGIAPFEIKESMFNSDRCILKTERELPWRPKKDWLKIERELVDVYGVSRLVIIGGNGTASTIGQVQKNCSRIELIIQILKTMDGDAYSAISCLGYVSALFSASKEIAAFKRESTVTGFPYLVRVLGRESGQVAFSAASKAEASLILIAEEFMKSKVKLTSKQLVDMLVASQLKTLAMTGEFGAQVLSEGMIDCLDLRSQKALGCVFKTVNRMTKIDYPMSRFEAYLSQKMTERFKQLGIRTSSGNIIVNQTRSIGYYPRAADPIQEDLALARRYGKKAGSLITSNLTGFKMMTPDSLLDFKDILDDRGEIEQCFVDTNSKDFKAQVKNQFRIFKSDLSAKNLKRMARLTKLSSADFKDFLTPVSEVFQRLSN